MIKVVIFDMDGLLIDSEILYFNIFNDFLNRYGHSMKIEEYTQNCSGKTAITNVEYLVNNNHLPLSVKEAYDEKAIIEQEHFDRGVELKQGALNLLDYFKEQNYKLIIASSNYREKAIKILNQHSIIHYFDDFIFGDEIERGKPFPDIFIKACEKANELPSNCLVLEDSEAGIQAAHSANIPVICIPDLKHPQDSTLKLATCVLQSLDLVIDYINEEIN